MPLHVSSTCAHHQEVKIALHSLWYHHTYRWPSRARDGTRQQLENQTAYVVTKRYRRELLMMGIMVPETC